MSYFVNLVDGGRRLGPLLRDAISGLPRPVLAPALPNGVPVALGIREALRFDIEPLIVERSDEGARVTASPVLAGRTVIVIDDGVETGTVARAAGAELRATGVAGLVLAVPVCPREAMADLEHRYDLIVSVVQPLVRRDLAWHYADFDTIDEAEALRLLESVRSR
jgi:predicted phosphoribosyltransferase